jgi:hypothetical protein
MRFDSETSVDLAQEHLPIKLTLEAYILYVIINIHQHTLTEQKKGNIDTSSLLH